jgi:hypothetical protein
MHIFGKDAHQNMESPYQYGTGEMIPLTQLEREMDDQARESKGQKEDHQAILAKLQLKNKWERKSSAIL